MMKKIFVLFMLILTLNLMCLNAYAAKQKSRTQLERREIETRFLDTGDANRVMRAAVNTLQDSGFVILEIEPELGYIRAQKTYKKRHINKARLAGLSFLLAVYTADTVLSYGTNAASMYDPMQRISNELHEKTIVVDSNVNVEKFGKNKTKVRLVLVQKVLRNADGYSYVKSSPMRVMHIYNPKIYQEFFAQLDNSVFYEGI
jgi:hypothetical protein